MEPTRDETVDGRDNVPDGGAESDAPEDSLAVLRSIYDVTTNKGLDFEEKIERLIAIGVEELDLPYGFLSEITVEDLGEEKGVQRISHAKGNHQLLQPGETAPLTNAYCRKTIQSDGLLAIHNAQEAGWEDDPAYETFDLGSYIGGKVEVEDELYGTFCFASTEPRDRDFSEAEQTLVQLLSKWASYELERERAKRTLETQRDNLEILSQVMRHDIRNNLQLVLAYAEMLEGNVDAEDAEYLDHILESAREAVGITTTAREVAEVMIQSDRDLEAKSLSGVLEDVIGTVRSGDRAVRIEVEGSIPEVEVFADDMLGSVFRNLLKNAVFHNDKSVPEIIIRSEVSAGTVTVAVADNGPGIPDERKNDIFREGEMGLESEGTGLGLYLVDTLVSRYGGEVHVEDNEPTGSVFVVELPVAD